MRIVAAVVAAFIGVALLVYPVVATRFNNEQQQIRANSYAIEASEVDTADSDREMDEADTYNYELATGLILDPFIDDVAPDSDEYRLYLDQLNLLAQMGQVKVPSVGINLPILHGTDDETLRHGVGHLFGSSLPIGGDNTHAVLTGHTGLSNATLFDHLTDVNIGDAVYLYVGNRALKYEVDDIRVVVPSETSSLKRQPGKDLLTLITCTPYGVNSHRLLVTGHRVDMDQNDADIALTPDPIDVPWEGWMIGLLAAAGVGLVVLAVGIRVLVVRRRRGGRPVG